MKLPQSRLHNLEAVRDFDLIVLRASNFQQQSSSFRSLRDDKLVPIAFLLSYNFDALRAHPNPLFLIHYC